MPIEVRGIQDFSNQLQKRFALLPAAAKDRPLVVEILSEREFDQRFGGNWSGIFFLAWQPDCPTRAEGKHYTAIHTDASGGVARTFTHEFGHLVQTAFLTPAQHETWLMEARAHPGDLPDSYGRENIERESFACAYEWYYSFRRTPLLGLGWWRGHLHPRFRRVMDGMLGRLRP